MDSCQVRWLISLPLCAAWVQIRTSYDVAVTSTVIPDRTTTSVPGQVSSNVVCASARCANVRWSTLTSPR